MIQIIKTVKEQASTVLDQISPTVLKVFGSSFRSHEQNVQASSAILDGKEKRRFPWGKISFSAFFILATLFFINFEAYRFTSNFPPKEYNNPRIFNMTRTKISWDVFYGRSENCGHIECHLTADYPESSFQKKMVLPAREFPLIGYKPADIIYLRATVRLPDAIKNSEDTIKLQSYWIWAKEYQFYVDGILIGNGGQEFLNLTIPKMIFEGKEKVTLAFRVDPGSLPYQGLANRGDLVIGEKALIDHLKHSTKLEESNYYLWSLLPQAAVLIVFCLMFFVFPWNREIFSFICFAFCSTVNTFLESSYYPRLYFGDAVAIESYAVFFNWLAGIFFMGYLRDFFGMRSKFFRKFYFLLCFFVVGLIVTSLLTPISSSVSEGVKYFLDFTNTGIGLVGALVSLLVLRKTNAMQIRVRIATLMLIIFCLNVGIYLNEFSIYIGDLMGHNGSFFSVSIETHFRSLFFFVFSAITSIEFGITHNTKEQLKSELNAIEERLELGRTVQSLLLPEEMLGSIADYDYQFYYSPYEKMSGDWLNKQVLQDGSVRLFIGDVVGKGPQAALAVAAISSILNESKNARLSTELTIKRLNDHILELFKSRINTTLSAIEFKEDGTIDLYNCGSVGWLVLSDRKMKHFPLRSAVLGSNSKPVIAKETISPDSSTVIFSFTDGCLEGARSIKKLERHLTKQRQNVNKIEIQDLIDAILLNGKDAVQNDDKTMIIVQHAETKSLNIKSSA
jgi:hypothetical protein